MCCGSPPQGGNDDQLSTQGAQDSASAGEINEVAQEVRSVNQPELRQQRPLRTLIHHDNFKSAVFQPRESTVLNWAYGEESVNVHNFNTVSIEMTLPVQVPTYHWLLQACSPAMINRCTVTYVHLPDHPFSQVARVLMTMFNHPIG